VVGSLQYLAFTRLDVAFAVGKVCQFMHKPTVDHWNVVKRILRYLKHTMEYGLLIQSHSIPSLQAFSDVDWVGDLDDCHSTSGYCLFFLGKTIISWSSQKQNTVSRSSTDVEYRAIANATIEII
jgi:hypothetical protein